MAGAKLAVATKGKVQDATKFKVVVAGKVKPVVRALTVKDGVARQFWPKTAP